MSDTRAIVWHPDGTTSVVPYPPPGQDALAWLQSTVGGWVERFSLDVDVVMWVNEDGKSRDLPINPTATRAWQSIYGPVDVIRGAAVLTAGPDRVGTTLGLTGTQVTSIIDPH